MNKLCYFISILLVEEPSIKGHISTYLCYIVICSAIDRYSAVILICTVVASPLNAITVRYGSFSQFIRFLSIRRNRLKNMA